MKTSLIIIVFWLSCLFSIHLQAQDAVLRNYPHYYQDGDSWVQALVPYDYEEYINENATFALDLSVYAFYVGGDTIIDEKEYKCVHARVWDYNYNEADNLSTIGYVERPQIRNILFMREDADGKQWRRLADKSDEALLFDFSQPFSEGLTIKYCKHLSLCDIVDYWPYREGAYANEHSAIKDDGMGICTIEDDAPQGYKYYYFNVSDVSTYELLNGERTPIANGHIAYGWGDVKNGDLWNQYETFWESYQSLFLFRTHQSQMILQNKKSIEIINKITETDVLTLFQDATGINELRDEEVNCKNHSDLIFNLSGQRLTKAQKGIYIQNGKVIVSY